MTSQQPQEPQHTQPTRIRDLPLTLLEKRFSTASLALDYGAAIVRVRSRLGVFVRDFQQVYGAFAVADAPPFADFHTEVCGGQGLRSFLRPQSRFLIDGIQPFDPFPKAQALPHFEWGVNWCFAQRFNQHVLLHAGALALGDRAVIMAAPPGARQEHADRGDDAARVSHAVRRVWRTLPAHRQAVADAQAGGAEEPGGRRDP